VAKVMETVSAQDASKLSIKRRKCESPLLRASHQSLAEEMGVSQTSAQLGRAWAHAAAGEKLQGLKRPDFIKMTGTSSASTRSEKSQTQVLDPTQPGH
jgi:hypothetical protein